MIWKHALKNLDKGRTPSNVGCPFHPCGETSYIMDPKEMLIKPEETAEEPSEPDKDNA